MTAHDRSKYERELTALYALFPSIDPVLHAYTAHFYALLIEQVQSVIASGLLLPLTAQQQQQQQIADALAAEQETRIVLDRLSQQLEAITTSGTLQRPRLDAEIAAVRADFDRMVSRLADIELRLLLLEQRPQGPGV